MTVLVEAPPTAAVTEPPIQRPDFEAATGWAGAAVRAHALLTQTMPDEQIDQLVGAAAPFDQAIALPPFLFG